MHFSNANTPFLVIRLIPLDSIFVAVWRETTSGVRVNPYLLSRRREHLHARALQIRAELSTHIHRETGPQRPTHKSSG